MTRKRSELPSIAYTIDEHGRPILLAYGKGVIGAVTIIGRPAGEASKIVLENQLFSDSYVSWAELVEMAVLEDAEKAAAEAAPPAGEGRAEVFRERTDEEIVDQTERMARIVLRDAIGTGYVEEMPEPFATSMNPRKRKAWDVACRIMEELTQTDPNDALSNLPNAEDENNTE